MSHQHTTDKTAQIVTVVAVAALVGAATAMLLTPRTGKETRDDLKRRASGVANKAKARFTSEEELEDVIEAVRERLQKTSDDAATAAKRTTTRAASAATKAKAKTTATKRAPAKKPASTPRTRTTRK